jgi:hypothetical protein
MSLESLNYNKIMNVYRSVFKGPEIEMKKREKKMATTLANAKEAQKKYDEWRDLVEELNADHQATRIKLEQSIEALRVLKASEKQMLNGKKVPRSTLRWLKNLVATKKQRGKKYDSDSARQAEFAANLDLTRKMIKKLEKEIPTLIKNEQTLWKNYHYESERYKEWFDGEYMDRINEHNKWFNLTEDARGSLLEPGPQTANQRYKNANERLVVT